MLHRPGPAGKLSPMPRKPGDKKPPTEFEKIALPLMNDLYFAGLGLTHNARDAEDLVQDTYLKAFRNFKRYTPDTNFKAWIYRILVNTYIDSYRKKARAPFLAELDEEAGIVAPAREEKKNLYDNLEALDQFMGDDVLHALNKLPPAHRLVVLLADVEEFKYREIAEILDIPIGTVMSRLHHAREFLRKTLWDYAVRQGYSKPNKGAKEA